jgi:acetyltransferase-like isoleucine patch superfamily enzyme/dTDP-4-dehydrorhamnose 3,5-epimerase-like enzyme
LVLFTASAVGGLGFLRQSGVDSTVQIHKQAVVEDGARIGARTRVWAFAHILGGAVLGEDCNVCDGVFIENDVVIGNRVTIKNGVQVWDGVTLEDDVFIGPNATFTNDKFPRSKQNFSLAKTIVRKGASVGANATILPGVTIGRNAMVGAGSVVTSNVPPNAIVAGNPARIRDYVKTARVAPGTIPNDSPHTEDLVGGVTVTTLPLVLDMRGSLSVAEFDKNLPFTPKRFFTVFNVPSERVRGEHAHKTLHEFLVCVQGACSVMVDDGKNRREVRLDKPNLGIYIPPMVWVTHYKYSKDAILLVIASDNYDPADYIRDYDEYLEALHGS